MDIEGTKRSVICWATNNYLSTNFLPHSGHWWFLIFWWVALICRFKFNRFGKFFPHIWQKCVSVSTSPFLCLSSWFFRNLAFLKSLPQKSQISVCFTVGCSLRLWITNEYSLWKALPQCSQKKNGADWICPGRWIWIWTSKSLEFEKSMPQPIHDLSLVGWTHFKWLWKSFNLKHKTYRNLQCHILFL